MKNLIVTFSVIIIIGFGIIAYFFWKSSTIVSMRYANPDYGFSINTPEGVTVLTNQTEIANSGYIPVCSPETAVVCMVFPESTYPNSNFSAAAIGVNVLTDKQSEAACQTPDANRNASDSQRVTIDGVAFIKYSTADAAMSHSSSGYNYRTFHNGQCFELTSRVFSSTYEVYEPGTIEKFTSDQETAITAMLDSTIQSFRFDE
jgi:phosphatidylglycerophosphatase A